MTRTAANPLCNLLACQRKALEHIQESAARERPRARDAIRLILERSGLDESLYDAVRDTVADLGLPLVRIQQERRRLEDIFREAAPSARGVQ